MSSWLKRALICASFAAGMLALAAGPASATEEEPSSLIDQTQEATNTNTTDQTANSTAETNQVNVNAPISILSYNSNNGDVNQSNTGNTSSTSYNGNGTGQSTDQGQTASTGGSSCDPCEGDGGSISQDQKGSNSNDTKQEANSEAKTNQVNVNVPISVLSAGSNNGNVDQSNDGTTNAYSGNSNYTAQGVTQDQGATTDGSGTGDGCGCDADGGDITQSQDGSNRNYTDQKADSTATTYQKNWNSPISILSIGSNNGDVNQSNTGNTSAWSRNENGTGQWIGQSQTANAGGSNCDPCDSGGGDISQTQTGYNGNSTHQDATSNATTEQRNYNVPISVLSIGGSPCGCGGDSGNDVTQSNDGSTSAYSGNRNHTWQGIGQTQDATSTGSGGSACPCEPPEEPKCPCEPVWTDHVCECDHQEGGDGITQSQDGSNDNRTHQNADSTATTDQKNWNSPISVLSISGHPCDPCGDGGSGGSVNQSNDGNTSAWSRNENATGQWIGQSQSATSAGNRCCPHEDGDGCCPEKCECEPCACDHEEEGDGISQSQTAANNNRTYQRATSDATTNQRNYNVPISVLSIGSGGGNVTQANGANTNAYSGNRNGTWQGIEQRQEAVEGRVA